MLYYDITDLLDHFRHVPRVGGIARVSTGTIARFRELARDDGLRLIAFHPGLRKPVVCDLASFPFETTSGPAFSRFFGVHYKGAHPIDTYVRRRYKGSFARKFNKLRLIASNILTKGKTFRRKGVGAPAIGFDGDRTAEWREPKFAPGDVIFLAGGTRGYDAYLDYLGEARRDQGVIIAQMLYDLLPLTHPQFFLQGHPLIFSDWLMRMNKAVDLVVACSEQTKQDYLATSIERGQTPARVSIVRLAHEYLESPQSDVFAPLYEKVSTPVLFAARLPYALCVGTTEVRKNNFGLIQIWDKFRRKHGSALPRLIFAGRRGWMNEDFENYLRRNCDLQDYVKIVDSPSDDELGYLYRNCLFTLFPSFCEGWGLPIGESLWFGRPAITSNLSSMPEVAGDYADYADPYDPASLEAAIERMLDPGYRQSRIERLATMKMRRWTDFSDELYQELRLAPELKNAALLH
jgi:glycosyltransferase involved in cell wall biosynthesis